jgi:hypothetical protein
MTGWLLTGAALLAAALAVGAYRLAVRRHQRTPDSGHVGICFYLHEKNVMNLYLPGHYEALVQHVEETTRTNAGGSVVAKVPGAEGRGSREAQKERIITYIREVGPITVIGRIVEELDRRDNIVYVNLFERLFTTSSTSTSSSGCSNRVGAWTVRCGRRTAGSPRYA